jgi:hypothetical protein
MTALCCYPRGQRVLLRGVAAHPYSRCLVMLARVVGCGLDVLQALRRRGRVSSLLAAAIVLAVVLWPELLIEVVRLRVEPILDAVLESVRDAASRTQER